MMRPPLLALLVLICLGSPLVAQRADPAGAVEPMRVRRVLVAEESVGKWLTGGTKYLPVDRKEFQGLLDRVTKATSPSKRPPTARLIGANYTARLVNDTLAEGDARLQIACDAQHETLLSLEPLSLALTRPAWEDGRPAIVGTNADGRATAVVPPDHEALRFSWSARGERTPEGLTFSLRLASAPTSVLVLELHDGFVPLPSAGFVQQPRPAEKGTRQWTILLGARNELTLDIRREVEDRSEPLVIARQELRYDIAETGVDLYARFDLTALHRPIGEVQLELDESLRVRDARLGNAPVPWSLSDDNGHPMLTLQLPAPVRGAAQVVVEALAPVRQDELWPLPHVRPRGVFWQEGRASLRIHEPLTIKQVSLAGCRQTGTGRLASGGREILLEYFESEASPQLLLSPARTALQAKLAQTLTTFDAESRLASAIDWSTSEGRRFRLHCRVPPGWTITDVEVVDQPGRLQGWSVEPQTSRPPGSDDEGATTAGNDVVSAAGALKSDKVLVLELAEALVPENPLRTLVHARRLHVAAAGHMASEPVPLLLPLNAIDLEGLLAISTEGRLEPLVENLDGFRPVSVGDLEDLDDEWHGRFPERPEGLLLRFQGPPPRGEIRWVPRARAFSASTELLAVARSGEVSQRYRLRCTPPAEGLDRIMVYFAQPTDGALTWSLERRFDSAEARKTLLPRASFRNGGIARATDSMPRTRLLPGEAHAFWDLPSTGALWEVLLPETLTRSFELQAELTVPFPDRCRLNLPWVVGSEQTDAATYVAATAGDRVQCEGTGVEALPIAAVPADLPLRSDARLCDVFVYGGPQAALTIRRAPSNALASVPEPVTARLESTLSPSGKQQHRMAYLLEPRGTDRFCFQLPVDSRLLSCAVDGVEQAVARHEGQYCVALSNTATPKQIVLDYEDEGNRWSLFPAVSAAVPQVDLPVASFTWHVALPPEYELVGHPSSLAVIEPAPHLRSWSQRLMGPLGRPVGAAWFNPLHRAELLRLAGHAPLPEHEAAHAAELDHSVEAFFSNGGGATATLADLLQHLGDASTNLPTTLIDSIALEEAGIGPDHRFTSDDELGAEPFVSVREVPRPRESSGSGASGRDGALALAGLTPLFTRDAVVLTTGAEARRLERWLVPQRGGDGWLLEPSALSAEIDRAATASPLAGLRFCTVPDWLHRAGAAAAPPAGTPAGSLSERAGPWPVVRLTGLEISPVLRLRLCRRPSIAMLGAALFLAVLAIGLCARNRSATWLRRWFATILLACWVAALTVPDALTPIFSVGALGVLVSAVAVAIARWRSTASRRKPRSDRSGRSTEALRPQAVGVLFLALLLVPGSAIGQPVVPEASDAVGTAPDATLPDLKSVGERWVLDPVDEAGRPLADEPVYVAADLLAVLRRHERGDRPAVVLTAAHYLGEVGAQTAQLRTALDLYALAGRFPISISIGLDARNLVPGTVHLDGSPYKPRAGADGTVAVELHEAGRHRVELKMRAPLLEGAAGTELAFRIPPTPQNRVTLNFPSAAAELVQLPGTIGRLEVPAPDRLEAHLGPVDLFTAHWGNRPGEASEETPVNVRTSLLWDVRPRAVVLKAHFRYEVPDGAVQRLSWLVGPGLELKRLNSSVPAGEPVVKPFLHNGERQQLSLDFIRPAEGAFEVVAEFVLADASGIGSLWLPTIVPQGADAVASKLAFYSRPGLILKEPASEELTPLPPRQFVDAWNDALLDAGDEALDPVRITAYQVSRQPAGLTLSTRPEEPAKTFRERLLIRPLRERVEMELSAEVTSTDAPTFSHRFRASPSMRVTDVSVEGSGSGLDRWGWNADNGQLTVFLTGSPEGTQLVRIAGWVPAQIPGRFPLPRLHSAEGERVSAQLEVSADEEFEVHLEKAAGLEPIASLPEGRDRELPAVQRFRILSSDQMGWMRVARRTDKTPPLTTEGTEAEGAAPRDATPPNSALGANTDLAPQTGSVEEIRRDSAEVVFCSVVVAPAADGSCAGESVYFVSMPARQGFTLDWPAETKLEGVLVDGRVVDAQQDDGLLSIPLPSRQMVREVVVRWQGHRSGRFRSLRRAALAAPAPRGVPVAETWWTVYPPVGWHLYEADDVESTDASQLALARLAALLRREKSLAELSWSANGHPLTTVLARRWAEQFDLQAARLHAPKTDVAARLEPLLREQADVVEQLGVAGEADFEWPTPTAAEPAARFDATLCGVAKPIHYVSGPAASDIAFRTVPRWIQEAVPAALLILVLLVTVPLGARLLLREPTGETRGILPGLATVGLGIAWWAWLEPSALGIPIAVGGLLLWALGAIRSRVSDEEGSVVMGARR